MTNPVTSISIPATQGRNPGGERSGRSRVYPLRSMVFRRNFLQVFVFACHPCCPGPSHVASQRSRCSYERGTVFSFAAVPRRVYRGSRRRRFKACVKLFVCTPMLENCHEAGSVLHVACACCDQRAGRADAAGFKRLSRQPRWAHGPRSVLLRGRWRPLLEFRLAACSSPTRPCQSACSRSTCASRLPQWTDLPVIVRGRRRPRRVHRLLSSQQAAARALGSSCHCRDIRLVVAERRQTCRRSSPSGMRALRSGGRLNWTRSDIKNWTRCEEEVRRMGIGRVYIERANTRSALRSMAWRALSLDCLRLDPPASLALGS
jgi:hypothetical protein